MGRSLTKLSNVLDLSLLAQCYLALLALLLGVIRPAACPVLLSENVQSAL